MGNGPSDLGFLVLDFWFWIFGFGLMLSGIPFPLSEVDQMRFRNAVLCKTTRVSQQGWGPWGPVLVAKCRAKCNADVAKCRRRLLLIEDC